MSRHLNNTNLILHSESTFYSWPIQEDKGPFICQYLHRLMETMQYAVAQYPRVFAFRVDLRLPSGVQLPEDALTNKVIERFIESFKAKIKHNRNVAEQSNPYAHDSKVRYVWAREYGQHGTPHYHLAILLNGDAFCALGKFEPERKNMFNRLVESWNSALGNPIGDVAGSVQIPDNPYYHLRRDDRDSQAKFFYRSSYLCKSASKCFGDGAHGFGCSRS